MTDHEIPPPEPTPTPDQLRQDLAAVSELVDAGVEVDGEVQIEASTWVVYGHTSYDGEVVVGMYHDEVEAIEVVHRAPHPHPHSHHDDDVPTVPTLPDPPKGSS